MDELTPLPEPQSGPAQALRGRLSAVAWSRRVRKALAQAGIVHEVRALRDTGLPVSQALHRISPNTPWPTFQYWNARVGEDLKDAWERLLDRRVPPPPKEISKEVRAVAVSLRRREQSISPEAVLEELAGQFGKEGKISETSLLRIWREAGLIPAAPVAVEEKVEQVFHGGAGLALIGAADAEVGASLALAKAARAEALRTVDRLAKMDLECPPEPEGRGERGLLTAAYNQATRAGVTPGHPDARWAPDYVKRQQRDLGALQVLEHPLHIVALKLLTMGLIPLITGRRGFDGLDGPAGEWLGVLGGVAYMPTTMDKFLAQLAFLDVEDGLWEAHAEVARDWAKRWASAEEAPSWLALVIYVDATQDPHWTDKYSMSGKVSRTGRVGPCLSRITVTAGPGIPLLMETYSGSVSLKKELPRVLERMDSLIGPGELGRITVMDAEMAIGKLFLAFMSTPGRIFITVLKGPNVATDFEPTSDWQPYRQRDQLREGTIVIHGEGVPKAGLKIRAVEMHRTGRHSQSTFFGTNATTEPNDERFMMTAQVADAYLSRWPHQEQLFRNMRNGLGLDKTHGYGGEFVQHVAIDTKIEKAKRRYDSALERECAAQLGLDAANEVAQRVEEADNDRLTQLSKLAKAELRASKAATKITRTEMAEIETTPREIFQRDPARENTVTPSTMTVLVLIDYVLREFFGGLKMELRTFIEHFVNLPVTVITTRTAILYRVHVAGRNPERDEQMRRACEEVTRRRIRRGGKTMVFEVVESERKRLTVQPA